MLRASLIVAAGVTIGAMAYAFPVGFFEYVLPYCRQSFNALGRPKTNNSAVSPIEPSIPKDDKSKK